MKRAGNLYPKIAEPENLREAFCKAARGKAGKRDVRKFGEFLDQNLESLHTEILRETVKVGDGHSFTVRDPKERLIHAAAFRERVLHHALMNICDPVFESYQIFDSYASRRGKGTHAALKRAEKFTRMYPWFAKLDVRKYFDSIDHAVLKGLLRRRFKDQPLLRLFDRIIDAYETSPGKGLPIGNLTSQYFANHVLAVADHYAKEELRLPGYIRYMDDMVMWATDKATLLNACKDLTRFIEQKLKLSLKPMCLNRVDHGIPLLGYVVYPFNVRLSAQSRKRFKGKLSQAYGKLKEGEWNQEDFKRHVQPLIAFTEHASSKGFRRRVVQG